MHSATVRQRPSTGVHSGSTLTLLRAWMADPLDFVVRGMDLGDIVVANIGSMRFWTAYDPALIEHVLVKNARNYRKETRGYRAMRTVVGQGLVTSQDELWKRQRRIANPAFRRKSIAAMGDVMAACASDLAQEWAAQQGPRDTAHDMMAVTLRIACRTFFSVGRGGRRRGPHRHRLGRCAGAVHLPHVLPLPVA